MYVGFKTCFRLFSKSRIKGKQSFKIRQIFEERNKIMNDVWVWDKSSSNKGTYLEVYSRNCLMAI
jgi:hypothetical protein